MTLPHTHSLDVSIERPQLAMTSDIVYSQPALINRPVGQLRLDLIRPVGEIRLPLVVFAAGGGFVSADKSTYLQQRVAIAEAGYVVASITYRVAIEATFPAMLHDIKAAIRFLRANATRFGIEAGAVAVMGDSAGGYLTALCASTNGKTAYDVGDNCEQTSVVQAAIDIYGLSDLSRISEGFSEMEQAESVAAGSPAALMLNGPSVFGEGGAATANSARLDEANPIAHVGPHCPPFLLMHGENDTLVSPRQTERLHEALLAAGLSSRRYVVNGAGHGGLEWLQKPVMDIIIGFLNETLKRKA
jgi:acetyl esterase/lipase